MTEPTTKAGKLLFGDLVPIAQDMDPQYAEEHIEAFRADILAIEAEAAASGSPTDAERLATLGHRPTGDGDLCLHRWRNRTTVAVHCKFLAGFRAASGSPTDAALREEPRCLTCGAPVVDALAGSCHQCGAEDRHIGSQWLAMPNDQRPSALRAASGSPEPVLDVERLARAMEDVFPGWLDEAPGTAEAQAEMRSYARQLGEAYEFLRGTASAALAPRPEPLDVERLAQTLPAVFNFRFSLAAKDDPVWLERAEAIAREYAALAPSEPTDG